MKTVGNCKPPRAAYTPGACLIVNIAGNVDTMIVSTERLMDTNENVSCEFWRRW